MIHYKQHDISNKIETHRYKWNEEMKFEYEILSQEISLCYAYIPTDKNNNNFNDRCVYEREGVHLRS